MSQQNKKAPAMGAFFVSGFFLCESSSSLFFAAHARLFLGVTGSRVCSFNFKN